MAERVTLKTATGRFEEGRDKTGGRQKGSVNKTTRILREAIILAAEQLGRDGKGKEGLVGYLKKLGDKHPELFKDLLARVLPMQITGPQEGPIQVTFTRQEAEDHLRERGVYIEGVFDKPVELLPPPKARVTNGHAR